MNGARSTLLVLLLLWLVSLPLFSAGSPSPALQTLDQLEMSLNSLESKLNLIDQNLQSLESSKQIQMEGLSSLNLSFQNQSEQLQLLKDNSTRMETSLTTLDKNFQTQERILDRYEKQLQALKNSYSLLNQKYKLQKALNTGIISTLVIAVGVGLLHSLIKN